MHESKADVTSVTVELPANRRTLTVKAGDVVKLHDGSQLKVVELPRGRGARVVLEVIEVDTTRRLTS